MSSSLDTQSVAASVLIGNLVLIALSTFCIGVKWYTRLCITKSSHWDDVFATIGYVFAMVLCINNCISTRYGLGRHIQTVEISDLNIFLKLNFAIELSYIISFVASKMAFVFFYLAIFPSKLYRRINFFLATILVIQLFEESIVVCLQCTPLRKAWTIGLPGKCLDLLTFFYVSFGIKLATDLVIFCLPIPMLRSLNVNRGKKIGVMVMFSLGLLVCIISIIRVTFLTNTSTDITWLLVPSLNWSTIEVCSLVICFCIPSFRAFFHQSQTLSRLLNLSTTHRSKYATQSRNQGSYQLESRGRRKSNLGNNTFIQSAKREDEVNNDSQVEILPTDGAGLEDNSSGKITVIKSVKVKHSGESV